RTLPAGSTHRVQTSGGRSRGEVGRLAQDGEGFDLTARKRPDFNMFPIFRAAAATGLFIASLGLASAPASAQTGIFDHAVATAPVSTLGLNDAAPARAAAPATVSAFEHAVGLSDVAAPASLTPEGGVGRL